MKKATRKQMTNYSSPQAYLNRFFRNDKKFTYTTTEDGLDCYENSNFRLVWDSGEKFYLDVYITDNDTNSAWYEQTSHYGNLIYLVDIIRKAYKNEIPIYI